MKVLSVSTAYPPSTGGAQLHQHMLMRSLRPWCQVSAACMWDSNRTDWVWGTSVGAPRVRQYEIEGVAVERLGVGLGARAALAPLAGAYYPLAPWLCGAFARALGPGLRRAADAGQAQVIHNVRIGRAPLSEAALREARRRGAVFALTPVHHPRWRGWRQRPYESIYRRADLIFALTAHEKRALCERGVRPERVCVTGVGPVLPERWDARRARARIGRDGPVVLFLGQHYRYKHFERLLEAAPRVWERVPEAQFVFVGPAVGASERCFAGRDGRVHRWGAVSLQDKADALAAADVLCLPSTQESFGGVFVEAWSMGKPVVGAKIPAVSELIEHGVDGLLSEPQPAALAGALIELLENPAMAQRMGEAGRRKVDQRYRWPRLAQRTLDAYQRALRGQPQLEGLPACEPEPTAVELPAARITGAAS